NLGQLCQSIPSPRVGPDSAGRGQPLRRLCPVLVASPGRRLLICELTDLDLRCLAEVCASSGSESRLAEWFRAGADPTLDVAKLLFAPDEDDGNRGRAFEALRARDPEQYSRCATLVRLFLEGVPRGLAPEHLRELIRQELGSDLTGVDVERG